MILDKNGKLFGKISIVDIAVVLVIIVGIIGFFITKSKLDQSKLLADDSDMLIKSSAEMDVLEVELKVEGVRDVTRDAIIVGDDVYLTANDKIIGTVVRVESTPAVRTVTGDNGVVYNAEVPEHYDVSIIIETKGKKKMEGYYTDSNIHLLYGKEMEIKTTTIQTSPRIEKITVVDTVS